MTPPAVSQLDDSVWTLLPATDADAPAPADGVAVGFADERRIEAHKLEAMQVASVRARVRFSCAERVCALACVHSSVSTCSSAC
jgi:hypothetical protein